MQGSDDTAKHKQKCCAQKHTVHPLITESNNWERSTKDTSDIKSLIKKMLCLQINYTPHNRWGVLSYRDVNEYICKNVSMLLATESYRRGPHVTNNTNNQTL